MSIDILWYRFVNVSYRASLELGQLSDSHWDLCKARAHTHTNAIALHGKCSIWHRNNNLHAIYLCIYILLSPSLSQTVTPSPFDRIFTSNLVPNWQWPQKYRTIIIPQLTSFHNGKFAKKNGFQWTILIENFSISRQPLGNQSKTFSKSR